jgi:hypothetical protein
MSEVSRTEIARQVIVGLTAGAVQSYAGPLAGTAASGVAPALLAGLDYVSASIGKRRIEQAAEALGDAADESGAKTPHEFIDFVQAAVRDERRQELLARALAVAQDTALRDKRRALGRALAAGIAGDNAKIDMELLFVTAVASIDTPHIRLLALLAGEPPTADSSADVDPAEGWSLDAIAGRDPGIGDVLPALLAPLVSQGLVRAEDRLTTWAGLNAPQKYAVTAVGRTLLDRLETRS